KVRTKRVLPRPGTPSKSACPPTKRHVSTPCTISEWPTMTLAISLWILPYSCRNCSARCCIDCGDDMNVPLCFCFCGVLVSLPFLLSFLPNSLFRFHEAAGKVGGFFLRFRLFGDRLRGDRGPGR